jgi:hypothetical protein
MIRSITVTNYLNESLTLELAFPEKSGFAVQKIDGLGPCKAIINTNEFASDDGGIFNSARVSGRNIVLSLKLLAKPTIETTRQLSYKYFPLKKAVTLTIETDNRLCETVGHVESNEPDIFSKFETAQISIICPDPYLYSIGEDGVQTTVFSGVESLFEFPFSNESLTENLIEFGAIQNTTEQNVYYSGDSGIGILITMHALGEVTNISIYNTSTRELMKLNTNRLLTLTGSVIKSGDEITISTVKGKKYVMLLRDGIYINILNCLDKKPGWFQLIKGDNIFAYTAETGVSNLQFRIENRTVYEGV